MNESHGNCLLDEPKVDGVNVDKQKINARVKTSFLFNNQSKKRHR